MKGSASVLSRTNSIDSIETGTASRWGAGGGLSGPKAACVIAAVYLVAHLPSLAPSLEDLDSINFALGLHDFDPARHQPHPPGYPVYIALGRISLPIVRAVLPSADPVRIDAVALALWS